MTMTEVDEEGGPRNDRRGDSVERLLWLVAMAAAVIGNHHAAPLLDAALPELDRWPPGYHSRLRA